MDDDACLVIGGSSAEQPTVTIHASDNGGKFKTCLPLFAGYSRVDSGVVEIESVSRLTLDDLATIDRVLRVYRNMHSMFLYSERDALTGLFNRKSFEDTFFKSLRSNPNMQLAEHAPREGSVEVERRTSAPSEHFWLAMVDVDHFKQVNDKFGHHIGDEVLILAARLVCIGLKGRVGRELSLDVGFALGIEAAVDPRLQGGIVG